MRSKPVVVLGLVLIVAASASCGIPTDRAPQIIHTTVIGQGSTTGSSLSVVGVHRAELS